MHSLLANNATLLITGEGLNALIRLNLIATAKEAFVGKKRSYIHLGVLSISSKHLNFLDLELKENSRKIKLLEIGLEDRRSVDPNLCPKNRKTFLLSISAVFVMQFLLEFT